MAYISWKYRCKKQAKSLGFWQNVVSFVENRLKLTESATDKNLVKTRTVSSTMKASSDLPPNLTAHDRARKYLTSTFHVNNGLMFCLYYNIVIAHLRKSMDDKHLDSALHKHLANFNQ